MGIMFSNQPHHHLVLTSQQQQQQHHKRRKKQRAMAFAAPTPDHEEEDGMDLGASSSSSVCGGSRDSTACCCRCCDESSENASGSVCSECCAGSSSGSKSSKFKSLSLPKFKNYLGLKRKKPAATLTIEVVDKRAKTLSAYPFHNYVNGNFLQKPESSGFWSDSVRLLYEYNLAFFSGGRQGNFPPPLVSNPFGVSGLLWGQAQMQHYQSGSDLRKCLLFMSLV